MLNASIHAHEGRFVATVDIKGAFLKAKVPEDMELMVKMTGESAQLMCKIDSSLNREQKGILYLTCVIYNFSSIISPHRYIMFNG
jgi:hypothetical protein